jgi:hypothetical protein
MILLNIIIFAITIAIIIIIYKWYCFKLENRNILQLLSNIGTNSANNADDNTDGVDNIDSTDNINNVINTNINYGNKCEGQCLTEYKGEMNMPVRHIFLIEDHNGKQYVSDYFKFKNWNQENLKAFIIDKTFYISNENTERIIESENINVIRNRSGPWQVSVNKKNMGWNLTKFAGVFDLTLDWIDLVGWDSYEYKIKMIL